MNSTPTAVASNAPVILYLSIEEFSWRERGELSRQFGG
jgi:hypothetical protein